MNRLCEYLTRQFFLVFDRSALKIDAVDIDFESTIDNTDWYTYDINC